MPEGYLWIDVLINIVLGVIMLGIGLSLTLKDFRNIFVNPVSLVAALVIQLVILPLIAAGIAAVSGFSPAMKVGVVVVSLCASGASSNLITHLFRGNVALAISMTTINSLLTLFTIPLMVNLAMNIFMGMEREVQIPVPETILQIFLVTILPATAGILFRAWKERLAKSLERPLKFILPGLLAVVFTVKIFFGESSGGTGISPQETLMILPWMLLLNILAMAAGFFGARLIRRPFADQYTISIEVGLHNTALALLISGTILRMPEMEKPAVVYAMFSFFTAIAFVAFFRWLFNPDRRHRNQ